MVLLNKKLVSRGLELINSVREFSKDSDLKISNHLKGVFGELLVANEIMKMFSHNELEYKSGQSGCDLELKSKSGKIVKIEVKTSTLKNEGIIPQKSFPDEGKVFFWGWRFREPKKDKKEKFDVAVLVALTEKEDNEKTKLKWLPAEFFSFRAKDVKLEEKNSRRFSNVKRSVILFERSEHVKKYRGGKISSKKNKPYYFSSMIKNFDVLLNKEKEKFKGVNKIRDALEKELN